MCKLVDVGLVYAALKGQHDHQGGLGYPDAIEQRDSLLCAKPLTSHHDRSLIRMKRVPIHRHEHDACTLVLHNRFIGHDVIIREV